ncbi:uncharacterized protein LOC142176708 [Nicotiana tabacum]|uniref:Uncharacterized protein LOC142176708 n=1 Tax=Nicotiana tabacum TaxID=4097 RepID=A0AC58TUV1_TOBAC
MGNFIVCHNKEKFNTTKHRLKLTFTRRTTVNETTDPLFPMNIFDLRSYNQLINKVDVNKTKLFDVIGEIVGFSEVYTHKLGGISRKFMDIELEDDERKKLSATFWGELLSVRDNYSERLTQTISQQSYSVSDELEKDIVQVKIIGQLVKNVPVGLLQVLKISNLKKGGHMLAVRSVKTRYKLQVRVLDKIGSVSLLLWDREAMFLIGKSINELKEGLLERKFLFKVIIKRSNIQLHGELYSVVKLTNDEQLINKYSSAPHSDAFNDSIEDNDLLDIANTPVKIGIINATTIVEEDLNAQLSDNKIKRIFKKKKTA